MTILAANLFDIASIFPYDYKFKFQLTDLWLEEFKTGI